MPPPLDTLAMLVQAARGAQPETPLSVPGSNPSVLPPQLFPQGQTPQPQPPSATSVSPPTSALGSQVEGLLAIPEYRRMMAEQEQNRQQLGTEMWRQKALATPVDKVVPGTGESGQPGLAGEMPKMQWGSKNKIVNALLSILGATGPGQAIQAQMYREPRQSWQAQRDATTKAIQDIKDQAAITGEQQKAIGEMALGGANVSIRQQRADAYERSVANHLALGTRNLDLKSMRVESDINLNKAKAVLDYALAQTAGQHIELGYSDQQARLQIANQARNTEMAKLPWFTRALNEWTGQPGAPALQPQQIPLAAPVNNAAPAAETKSKTKRPSAADLLKKYPPAQTQ